MRIEAREDGHLEPLAAAIAVSSRTDRWPPHRPAFDDSFDPARFLASRDEVAAFVAVEDDVPVGHIALHATAAPAVVDRAAAYLQRPAESLVFVARMYVSPPARRRGTAARLLEHAAGRADELGRFAVLDVWEGLAAANAFYEACGWPAVGAVTISFSSPCSPRCAHQGSSITSFVRLMPGRPTADADGVASHVCP